MVKNWIKRLLEHIKETREKKCYADIVEEANTKFNIQEFDKTFYVMYGEIKISRASDVDVLERLQEIRQSYIKTEYAKIL